MVELSYSLLREVQTKSSAPQALRCGYREGFNLKGLRVCGCRSLNRQAGANDMAVAVDIVHASDGGPEFVLACPRGWASRLLTTVQVFPFVDDNRVRGMRRIFQRIFGAILRTRFDGLDLGMDRDHRVAKLVEFGFG